MNKLAGEYSLKILIGTWGIRIDIGGSIEAKISNNIEAEEIAGGIHVQLPLLDENSLRFAKSGILRASSEIQSRFSCEVLVQIQKIDFSLCDYQPEGLELAVANWLYQLLGLGEVECRIDFDKLENRYLFDFA